MDNRMKRELDHYLTTPPEADAEPGMCVGCGQEFDLAELDEEGLCKDCVKDKQRLEDQDQQW